jgi:hypothetical protein
MRNSIKVIFVLLAASGVTGCKSTIAPDNEKGLSISSDNPLYWEYNGKKTLLLGGSVQDNLFQIHHLTTHLDSLAAAGGNYVRNTMSSRDPGNVWPFIQREDGLYDLEQWNEEYWRRFSTFLEETAKRDIVVQMEVWATFDYYRNQWDINPWNPKNNINYDARRSKLSEVVDTHPIYAENNFFRSVPSQMALMRVLDFQQSFVDKILSYSLQYDHVLYCMDNETSVSSDWGKFWAQYIQKKAFLAGKTVYTTEMWDPWNLSHVFHLETFDNPDIFTFVDISQNNHQSGDAHWNNALGVFERLDKMGNVRPVNNVKVYGNDGGVHKRTQDAIENFVKNILVGCASARFHRPTSGQGLNALAQAVIRSVRNLTDRMDFFDGYPRNDLLIDREEGEAYCRAIPDNEYAIFFPGEGVVTIDLSGFHGNPTIAWLNLFTNEWSTPISLRKEQAVIRTPNDDFWIALIQ